MQYVIYEGNMERLEKKLNRIYNKCKAYGCEFHYAQVGETFKPVKDDKGNVLFMARYILVEAEGTAVVNNWEFVASVEHTEKGNIFSGILGIEVPQRYYDSKPVCEHCNTSRPRKYTYIIRNKETGEFKQVGKACLKDYTHGMSAEMVAQYISMFDTLIEGEAPEPGCKIERYLDKEEYLRYVAETIRHYGYVSSAKSAENNGQQGTALRAVDYYEASHGRAVSRDYLEHLQEEMAQDGFNPGSPETVEYVKDALDWIAGQREYSNYIHNLKTACSLQYITYKNFGLLASLFPAYERDLKKTQEWKESRPDESHSAHVGNTGDTVSFKAVSVKCLTSWEGQFGTTRLYKFVDEDGNVYTWKTGKFIEETTKNLTVTGKVKGHAEFRGIKQTEINYCQITILQ